MVDFSAVYRKSVLFFFALALPLQAYAIDGIEFVGLGPIQKGTAGAGVAAPKDASWMLLNPASIVDLHDRIDFYIDNLNVSRSFTPRGNPIAVNVAARKQVDSNPAFIPGIGAVITLNDDARFAVGIYGIAGSAVDFARSRTTLSLFKNADRRSGYQHAKIPLVYARRLPGNWALGVGLHINIARMRSDSITLGLRPAKSNNNWDEAFGIGFQIGVYKKWEKVSLAAAYTSRQWMTGFDNLDDLLSFNLDLPQKFRIGLAYRPIPKVELTFDYKFTNFQQVSLFANRTSEGGLGWEDQHIFKTGLTYYPNKKWTLRGGYSFGNSPVDNDDVFSNALFPSLSEKHAAIGFSRVINNKMEIHASFLRAFKETLTENGRGDLFSILGRGSKLSLAIDSITIGFTRKFNRGQKEQVS